MVLNFLLDLETNRRDFRQTRLQRFVVHLVEFMTLLDDAAIEATLIEARSKLAKQHEL